MRKFKVGDIVRALPFSGYRITSDEALCRVSSCDTYLSKENMEVTVLNQMHTHISRCGNQINSKWDVGEKSFRLATKKDLKEFAINKPKIHKSWSLT